MRLSIAEFPAALRIPVRHASATRRETENVICLVENDGLVGVGEGCPRSYVTGETVESARAWLGQHAATVVTAAATSGVDGLRSWTRANSALIDSAPAAFCALELALLDILGRSAKQPLEELLGHGRLDGPFAYTAVIGDSSPLIYTALLGRYVIGGFRDVKIKLSGDRDRDRAKVRWLRSKRLRVRADANNLWTTSGQCIDHLRAIGSPFFAIEEPLQASDITGFSEVAEALGTRVILDESALRASQLRELPGDPNRWILNCRVSKMGGLLRSLAAVAAASDAGLGVIVGAQVGETSILTRAALPVSAHAGGSLLAQEGAFGTRLLREDLVEPVVMFGRAGRLKAEAAGPNRPGLGLDVHSARLKNVEPVI